jgi:putative acetyltransferase
MNFRIEYLTHPTLDFISLVDFLDAELHSKNGELQKTYDHFNTLNGITDFFIAYREMTPVGSAAMKQYDGCTYEIKRVFVKKEYCGNGVSKLLMKKLEETAAELNIKFLILETSEGFVEAMNFTVS